MQKVRVKLHLLDVYRLAAVVWTSDDIDAAAMFGAGCQVWHKHVNHQLLCHKRIMVVF